MKKLLSISLVICLTLAGYAQKKVKPDTTVYKQVEVNPQYPGGKAALSNFLLTNLQFKKVQTINSNADAFGHFVIRFIIEKDGTISHLIQYSSQQESKGEPAKLLKSMPRWSPGILDGKPVRMQLTIPVSINVN